MSTPPVTTILLVEDEVLIAMDEKETLRGFGYEVVLAHSGEEAIEKGNGGNPIDLILMDIDLGRGMDGTEAARRILESKNMPIVFLTSHSEREMVERVRGITCYGYVIKNSGDFVLRSSIEMAFELFEAHEKSRANESRMRTLINTIPDLVWLKDINGVYLSCNWMFERFFGATEAEILGKTDYDFMDEDLADFFRKYDRMAMEAEHPGINEEWLTFASDGHRALVETIKTPLVDENGMLVGVLGIARDITDRTRIEEALSRSEAKFRAIYEQAPHLAAILDLNGILLETNHTARSFIAIDRDSIVGKPFWETPWWTHSPGDQEILRDAVQRAAKGEMFNFDTTHLDREGNVHYIEFTLKPVKGDSGEIFCLLAEGRDVTSERNSKLALIESEARLRAITSSARDAIIMVDSGDRITFWNDAAGRMFGYSHREAVGRELHALLAPGRYRDGCMKGIKFFSESGRGEVIEKTLELKALRRDGIEFPIELSLSAVQFGGEWHAVGIMRDITERTRMEESLRESEHRYRSLIENAPMPIVLVDAKENIILYANKRATDMLGLDPAEAAGLITERFWADPMARRDYIDVLNERGYITDYEARLRTTSGQEFWALLSGSFTIFGGRRAILTLLTDITERIKVEEALAEALSDNKELLRELQHRIKNSFSIIAGMVGIEARHLNDPATRDLLHDLRGRIISLASLYDMLYKSRSVKEIQLDAYLGKLCTSIFTIYQPGMEGIRKDMRFDSVTTEVKQAIPIGLILNELLTNVFKYAFPGGGKGTVKIRFERRDGQGILEVADDGAGLPPDFDIKHPGGTGLGLVGMLVSQLEGTLSLGKGRETVFRITFPMA